MFLKILKYNLLDFIYRVGFSGVCKKQRLTEYGIHLDWKVVLHNKRGPLKMEMHRYNELASDFGPHVAK